MTFRSVGVPVLAAVLTAVGCGGEAGPPPLRGPYTIGFALNRHGFLAPFDVPIERAMRVAVDEVNRHGGLAPGVPLELRTVGVASDPARVALGVQRLIEEGADFVVTPCDTDIALGGARVAVHAGVPVATDCGGGADFAARAGGEGAFLLNPGVHSEGRAQAAYVLAAGHRRALLVSSPDQAYTDDIAASFAAAFRAGGGRIVRHERFHFGTTGFPEMARRLAAERADVLVTTAFPPDSVALLDALDDAGLRLPIVLDDANDSPAVLAAPAGQLARARMTTLAPAPTPEGRRYLELYRERWGRDPESLEAVLGADLVGLLVSAVRGAGTARGEDVSRAFAALEDAGVPGGSVTYAGRSDGVPLRGWTLARFARHGAVAVRRLPLEQP